MWTVPIPAHPAAPVYQSCIRGIRDQDLKDRLEKATESVTKADLNYRRAGAARACGGLPCADFELPDVTAKEMTWLYENKMVGKKAPGRPVYDAIRAASPQGRCPLCGHRDVTTVDHYLPKSAYAALAVNPANLIPACSECNRMKSAAVLDTLHPYYDNVERERWLSAQVLETSPPAVEFAVQPPESWPDGLSDRVRRHFATFELGLLYSMQAAREISGIKARLDWLLREGGSAAVRDHLRQDAASRQQAGLNSWQAACYVALAASDWLCAGGFKF
jgi:5-methylcytosine-specific restriction endonuclease McrA